MNGWIYAFGGTIYSWKAGIQIEMSNLIQRIDTSLWGSTGWQEVETTGDTMPRLSHAACGWLGEGTKSIIIWGGDYEEYGAVGFSYI